MRLSLHSLAERYLYPDQAYNNIDEIDLGALYTSGIKGLILDIDNTLIAPGVKKPDSIMVNWLEAAREAGFDICLLSNASRHRVAGLSSGFGIYAVARASKPSGMGFLKAMRLLKLGPSQVCVIGDQIFTDILGARRLGILALRIKPITRKEEPTVVIKRFAEYFILKWYHKTTCI